MQSIKYLDDEIEASDASDIDIPVLDEQRTLLYETQVKMEEMQSQISKLNQIIDEMRNEINQLKEDMPKPSVGDSITFHNEYQRTSGSNSNRHYTNFKNWYWEVHHYEGMQFPSLEKCKKESGVKIAKVIAEIKNLNVNVSYYRLQRNDYLWAHKNDDGTIRYEIRYENNNHTGYIDYQSGRFCVPLYYYIGGWEGIVDLRTGKYNIFPF